MSAGSLDAQYRCRGVHRRYQQSARRDAQEAPISKSNRRHDTGVFPAKVDLDYRPPRVPLKFSPMWWCASGEERGHPHDEGRDTGELGRPRLTQDALRRSGASPPSIATVSPSISEMSSPTIVIIGSGPAAGQKTQVGACQGKQLRSCCHDPSPETAVERWPRPGHPGDGTIRFPIRYPKTDRWPSQPYRTDR